MEYFRGTEMWKTGKPLRGKPNSENDLHSWVNTRNIYDSLPSGKWGIIGYFPLG
jgi:hypothetical protein